MKPFPSVFSLLYTKVRIFEFAVSNNFSLPFGLSQKKGFLLPFAADVS